MVIQNPSRTEAPCDEYWLFGYGSLIWKPPPHFDRRIPGYVTGYVRRFWQVCKHTPFQDHRGTPEAPGRVVTLIERSYWEQLTDHHDSAPEKVWGVAYRIVPDRVDEVKEYLDIREINGYTIHYTPFHPVPGLDLVDPALMPHLLAGPILTLVYIGTPDNDQFVGPQDPQALAEHIYRSEGPSGLNRDYLWELEKALDQLSAESGDEHVTDLSSRVRVVAARDEEQKRKQQESSTSQTDNNIMRAYPLVNVSPEDKLQQHHHHHDFRQAGSIDEQEETEKTS
ncbi:ChaC-like protein-domain-containing protein [Apodospora peruviana]|uniref:glutathione-specific gamma-glutamylcyclotransferase n=1 Tax=Apodospora peruviana TaxID=516989 RepID=A0AAE0MFI1_9PEZI|nr:ChaC-like protein-domain-containing protein [Apodospora peruviana]